MPNYKKYNGVQYNVDPGYDYSDEIARYANAGDYATAARLEQERNAKIQGEGLNVATTNQYSKYLPKSGSGSGSSGGSGYNPNVDYSDLIADAAAKGDYAAAYRYEQQRNAKIQKEGINAKQTHDYERYNPATRYTYDPTKNADYQKASADAQKARDAIQHGYDPQQDAQYQMYSQQMNELYQKIMNGGKFEYDVSSDPLYQQYREQYMAQGKQAMRDTMGQAAALTGGYGNTYAQTAGDQAYGRYLERLNDVVPELYSAAYGRYRDEQNALAQQYQMAAGMADTAYQRGYQRSRDERSDALQEYEIAQQLADQAYQRDYQNWSTQMELGREDEINARNRYLAQEQQDYERGQTEQQNNWNKLVALLAAGYTPTAADLAAAGMTQQQADALRQQYLMSFNSGGTGGGSSGRRSSGGSRRSSGRSSSAGGTPTASAPAVSEFSEKEMPSAQYSGLQRQVVAYINKGDADTALQLVAKNKSSMTEAQYNAIIRLLEQM